MNVRSISIATSLLIGVLAVACGGAARRSGFETEKDPTLGADAGDAGPTLDFETDAGTPHPCSVNRTSNELDKDFDGDGYALKDDCDECNTGTNKGAQDIPGNGVDEDCSGTPDDEAVDCDANIDLEPTDAFEGARAMGLCKKADPNGVDWGVVEAKWVKPDGKKLTDLRGVGVLPAFGVNAPQSGVSMLALSSGIARSRDDDGFNAGTSQVKNYTSGTPDGYPKESPACQGVISGDANDGASLLVKIRVPSNAKSFSYQQFFFTFEYPIFICDRFNDFFVTMLDPIPDGQADGNVAYDQDSNPISVNNSLLQVCTAGTHGDAPNEKHFDCPLGPDLLEGTGFEGHGGTGWLTTTAPVAPGKEITLLFSIWDSADGRYDSTVLVDDFKFSLEEAGSAKTLPTDPK